MPHGPDRIVILGGGASGTLLAAELLRRPKPVSVTVVEPRDQMGAGVAYSTNALVHRLNVRAGRMSGRADAPDHFLRWLRIHDAGADEGTFAPRPLYRRYLGQLLVEARLAAPASTFEHIRGHAVEIHASGDGYRIAVLDGRSLRARTVVLALGNLPPALPAPLLGEADPLRVIADPWAPGALEPIGKRDGVLLLGAGLTAIDVALLLGERGHRGALHLVSRRGLLPRVQAESQPPLEASQVRATGHGESGLPRWAVPGHGVRAFTAALRTEIAHATARGSDWHEVFEALRPHTQDLWRAFSVPERRRFLRHLQPWWDAHRHRMPWQTALEIDALFASGRLVAHAARLVGLEARDAGLAATLRPRGAGRAEALLLDRLVNCTGPAPIARSRHPLIQHLFASGLARPDPFGLGLDARKDGAVLGRDGSPTPGIFTLGPLLKGVLWETTSVPEIRLQAAALGRRLTEEREVPTGVGGTLKGAER